MERDLVNHCVRIYEQGPPSVLRYEEEAHIVAPGPGEVRLRHDAIGVNFVDTMFRDGTFQIELPMVMGIEGAGVVEATGTDVTNIEVGERFGYFYAPGSYASVRNVPVAALVHLPPDISTEQSATFLGKGLTAWMGVRLLHEVQPGETVLVQGASGGAGAITARWAKALGAKVLGTAGSPGKLAAVAAGVDHALLSTDPAFAQKVAALAPDGVDIVMEFVGAATFSQSVQVVRDGGTVLTIGAASGQPQIDHEHLRSRGIQLAGGSTVRNVHGEKIGQAVSDLFEALRAGAFAGIEPLRYPLSEARTVHELMAGRRLSGPVVLIP